MPKAISSFENKKILYNHYAYYPEDKIRFGFHVHDICEVIFLKSGDTSAIIGHQIYKLHKHSLIIFRANIPHKIVVEENSDYERYNLLFDENNLANQIFHKIPDDFTLMDCSGNDYIIDLFKKYDFYCKTFQGEDLEILLTNITEELIYNIYLSASDDPECDILSMHPLIGKAVKFINQHYAENITIDDISSHLCITKSHLHHLFVEFMKITPKKYITIRRLAKAQKLIRMDRKPSDVYSVCGFGDYATFYRNYILHFGYAPSEEGKIIKERKIES